MIGIAVVFLAAADPRFAVETAAGQFVDGVILSLDGRQVIMDAGPPVPTADVIEIRRTDGRQPQPPLDRPHLRLTNGDIWPGEFLEWVEDHVLFRAEFGPAVIARVPVERVAVIETVGRSQPVVAAQFADDRVTLRNGDVLLGTVVQLPGDGPLRLDQAGRLREVERGLLRRIEPSTELAGATDADGVTTIFIDGSRLTCPTISIDDGHWTGRVPGGPSIRRPISDVARMTWNDGRTIPLADLTPRVYRPQPDLAITWPVERWRSRDGTDPLVRWPGSARAVYDVPIGATRFTASAAIDGPPTVRASQRCRVLVDEKLVREFTCTADDPPVVSRIDVPPLSRQLILETESLSLVGGTIRWSDARFVRPDRPKKPAGGKNSRPRNP